MDVQATGEPSAQFLNFFLLSWVFLALLDPDTDLDSEPGSGSADLIESGQ
jgi:hypothetical protein